MDSHERVYRLLLVAYPPEHRHHYREPMVQVFRDRLRDEGGGTRSVSLWVQVLVDLVGSALAERKVALVDTVKNGWWRLTAGIIAVLLVIFGIGNLVAEDDGPLYGQLLALAVTMAGAALIVAGLSVRARNKKLGSRLVGLGVLPGAGGITLFWFPPAVLVGLVSIATAAFAFGDASRREGAPVG